MARGIERQPIFRERADYSDFLARLETAATWCGASVFAWALIPAAVARYLGVAPSTTQRQVLQRELNPLAERILREVRE